jgi:heavy metal sensor kinase
MPFRSIRAHLTLWYVGVLAVILILFAVGAYAAMRRTLNESLDDGLENRAFLTQELLVFDDSGRPDLDWPEDDPNLDDTFQRIIGAGGEILFDNSRAFGDVAVDPQALARALAGRRHLGAVDAGVQQARVLTIPIERDGRIVGALQAGESTSDVHDTLRILLLVFAVALPAGLVLATAGGYWLSSRALGPIDKITRAAHDISERDLSSRLALDLPDDEVGRLARTFDGMIERLDAAFQRQRQFTADASHELRTPLTAIRGQIDVALQRPRDAASYQQVLATINDQVERMTRLVKGLLMLARTDARALGIERERVDIAGLVRSVADQVRPLVERKGLLLDVVGSGDPVVNGDEDLLLQLVLNLVDNAIKYTETGGVTLSWRAADGVAQVNVSDTGSGIDPEDQAHIFERFYRVGAARTPEGGAGLGLSICRWIAVEHGGDVTVESSGAGSQFTVSLPSA